MQRRVKCLMKIPPQEIRDRIRVAGIRNCIAQYPASKIAVLPDNPFVYPVFKVRNKSFVYMSEDQTRLHLKALREEQEALVAEDPAAARRCLLITGGKPDLAPAGVVCLTKPFRPDELITAVGALHPADSGTGSPAAPAACPLSASETAPAWK